jgi:sigma-B regulation protein RsbU (phosphoserine phosphatase)
VERAGLARRLLEQITSNKAPGRGTLLPPGVTAGRDYDFGLTHRPGLRPGGDLCERVPHDTGGNSVLMVDVAGNGAPAIATAALVQGLFIATASPRRSSAGSVAQINGELFARSGPRGCLTLWTARFDRGGEFTSCCAGYSSPFWVPADGGVVQRLTSGGPPAGAIHHYPFEEEHGRLLPGDLILGVSNGVFRAEDYAGNEFGEARVLELLEERRRDPLDRLGAALCDAALAFGGRPGPVDDLVVLAVRYAPGG